MWRYFAVLALVAILVSPVSAATNPPVFHLCPAPPCNSLKVTGTGNVDDVPITLPGVPSTAIATVVSLQLLGTPPYVKASLSGPAGGPYYPLNVQMPVPAYDAFAQGLVPSQGGLIHYSIDGAGTAAWEIDLDAIAYYGP